MPPSQDEVFFTYEGDNWFERNKEGLKRLDPDADFPLKLMELYDLQPRSVLEVGAANGYRLAAIAERFKASVVGVEPSAAAIADGKTCFPAVKLIRGMTHDIPLQDVFDLVIVNFVLSWIDRAKLLDSVAELDRLLVDGGYLIVGDFYPSQQTRVRYHHLPDEELYTYKQDYGALFVATGLYHLVGLIAGDHATVSLAGDVADDERIAGWLLRKDLTGRYVEGAWRG
jgi:SAM-dependent methyltransferase